MQSKAFIYRLYGRSRLRSKKNIDYNKSKLEAAIDDYMKRSRRYGNIVSGLK